MHNDGSQHNQTAVMEFRPKTGATAATPVPANITTALIATSSASTATAGTNNVNNTNIEPTNPQQLSTWPTV